MKNTFRLLLTGAASMALLGAGCSSMFSTAPSADVPPAEEAGLGSPNEETKPSTGVTITTGATATTASPKTVTISITGQDFTPASITIEQGTTVVFKNDSSTSHWPASAPHPTHTDYPEFDPKQEIEPGQSWSFTFNKVGSWRYHDHMNSGVKGVITVTAPTVK